MSKSYDQIIAVIGHCSAVPNARVLIYCTKSRSEMREKLLDTIKQFHTLPRVIKQFHTLPRVFRTSLGVKFDNGSEVFIQGTDAEPNPHYTGQSDD